jgi:NAD(P)-dependent dehydrogenase (short-subunit alcohol dehydrogenase family)
MKLEWGDADIPDLAGKTAIVTGASSGIGYEIARQLVAHGAHVVLASRHEGRTGQAARRIEAAAPGASVEARPLDLADLSAVRRFADEALRRHRGLDILVNNAGIAGGPRRETSDGFEMHFQVNYLGHFALTGLLLPALLARTGARVVSVSSDIAAKERIDFDDLQGGRKYRFVTAYAQSKLANLLFAFELERRSQSAGAGITSLAAHPGVVKTAILSGKESEWGQPRRGMERVVRTLQALFGKSPAQGALPLLYQATEPSAKSAEYIGPSGGRSGYPATSKIPTAALDRVVAKRLWDMSEAMTGVRYEALSRRIYAETRMPGLRA